MADQNILSSEELEFIGSLMGTNGRGTPTATASFRVDGGPQSNDFLMRLVGNAGLTLQAQFDQYCLAFSMHLAQDEFHSLQMTLSAPTIYERGPVPRAWRLQLETPLPLLEVDGSRSPLSVKELSPSGLLVRNKPSRSAPERFHLMLALPEGEALPVDARRVRHVASDLTAYTVDFAEERDAERVRRYLFEEHRHRHPELNEPALQLG
ncbi:PilZ domain-containing protein [Stutzerimonas urumqiensis]|uniref:PilZ domain-containing protein n=1 Tax=Stutzerimonas urumqiensis TaxID=638269 RepID=UPI003DA3A24A